MLCTIKLIHYFQKPNKNASLTTNMTTGILALGGLTVHMEERGQKLTHHFVLINSYGTIEGVPEKFK